MKRLLPRIALLLATLCPSSPLLAQELAWSLTRGGPSADEGVAALELADGYLIVGYSASFKARPDAEYSAYFVRLDTAGTVLWERAAGSYRHNTPVAAFLRGDSEVVVVGHARDNTPSGADIYFGRFDLNGIRIDERKHAAQGDEWIYEVRQLADGGFIAVGHINGDGVMHRLDAEGGLVWRKVLKDRGIIRSVDTVPGGGLIAAGTATVAPAINGDAFLIRLAANGDSLRHYTYGTAARETGHLVRSTDSGFVVIGSTDAQGGSRMLVTRVDLEGRYVAAATVPMDRFSITALERDGDAFLFGGSTDRGSASGRWQIGRIAATGEILWSAVYDGSFSVVRAIHRARGHVLSVGYVDDPPSVHAVLVRDSSTSGISGIAGPTEMDLW